MKNFGFGCMRLPLKGSDIDDETFSRMIDRFLEAGFTYFDTARGYMDGKSEAALKRCLTSRYPRERYSLTDKLSNDFFKAEEDIRPLFEDQLVACGVAYFDYYLMHAQTAESYRKYVQCGAYRIAEALKAEGKIKHVGISFHDKAAVLERILTEQPKLEVVQIQFNYADFDDPSIEARKCWEVCRKHSKPVIVMEPVKGGNLVRLPDAAAAILHSLQGGSTASYAIRFAASFDGVMMVLSGMSDREQLEDNLSFMQAFKPLSQPELEALEQVVAILKKQNLIPCTACRYCVSGCPKRIAIPDLFACMNAKKQYQDWNSDWYYGINTQSGGKASDCVECGQCEKACPQHLEIRKLLKAVAEAFEKPEA